MCPTKNSQSRNQAKSPHFTDHRESSQPICKANQLTGSYKRQAPIKRYLKTDWIPLCELHRGGGGGAIYVWYSCCVLVILVVLFVMFCCNVGGIWPCSYSYLASICIELDRFHLIYPSVPLLYVLENYFYSLCFYFLHASSII